MGYWRCERCSSGGASCGSPVFGTTIRAPGAKWWQFWKRVTCPECNGTGVYVPPLHKRPVSTPPPPKKPIPPKVDRILEGCYVSTRPTITEWMNDAPHDVWELFDLVTFTNALRDVRNDCFQLSRAHDGSISGACEAAFRRHFYALDEMLEWAKKNR